MSSLNISTLYILVFVGGLVGVWGDRYGSRDGERGWMEGERMVGESGVGERVMN